MCLIVNLCDVIRALTLFKDSKAVLSLRLTSFSTLIEKKNVHTEANYSRRHTKVPVPYSLKR